MKRIVFNLKHEWYDKIASGEKTVEYRRICDHWTKRFEISPSVLQDLRDGAIMFLLPDDNWLGDEWYAVFRLGYSRKYPDIVRRITTIDISPCPYPGWNGKYFRIHFTKEGGES